MVNEVGGLWVHIHSSNQNDIRIHCHRFAGDVTVDLTGSTQLAPACLHIAKQQSIYNNNTNATEIANHSAVLANNNMATL